MPSFLTRTAHPFALILLVLGCSAIPAKAQTPMQLAKEAVELHEQGKTGEAILRLEQALQLDPAFVPGYITLAQLYLETGQPPKAERAARKALAVRMNNPDIHTLLGLALFRQERYAEALQQFERVLELRPDHPRARSWITLTHLNLGIEAFQNGQKEKAVREFSAAVHADPNNPQARRNLAVALYETGNPRKAEVQLLEALKLAPHDKEILSMLLSLYKQQRKFERALQIAEKLYQLEPDNLDAALELAFLYRFNNRSDRAIALYRKLLARYPREKRIYDDFANLYVVRGKYKQAIGLYRELLEKTSENREIYREIGKIYEMAEKYGEARQNYRNALQGGSCDGDIYQSIAETYLTQNRPDRAAQVYREALEAFPDDWQLQWNLGRVYEQYDPRAAADLYRTMLKKWPENGELHVRLGEMDRRLGNRDQAVAHFQQAVKTRTRNPLPYHRLAAMMAESGDTLTAVRHEKTAISRALEQIRATTSAVLLQLQTTQGPVKSEQVQQMRAARSEIDSLRTLLREGLERLYAWEDPVRSEAHLAALQEENPENPVLQEFRARLLARQGQPEEALEAYRRLVKLDPKNKAGHLGMAAILEAMGRSEEAILAYKRALTIDGDDPEIYRRLENLYAQRGQLDRLAEEWTVLARRDPERKVLLESLIRILKKTGRSQQLIWAEGLLKQAKKEN